MTGLLEVLGIMALVGVVIPLIGDFLWRLIIAYVLNPLFVRERSAPVAEASPIRFPRQPGRLGPTPRASASHSGRRPPPSGGPLRRQC